jgi:NAD(P)H-hydrate epimerase
MKILSAAQIRETDRYTIAHEPISSIDLMERAAAACTSYILEQYGIDRHYLVVCGRGNNGGDGLAIARMLRHASCSVEVYILDYTTEGSPDFIANLELLRTIPSTVIHEVYSADGWTLDYDSETVLIDAILGTGINKATTGLIADTITLINRSGLRTIAIDVPSGLPVDEPMPRAWPVVRAAVTLSFQQPKLSFLFPESGAYVGELRVLDIGWDRSYVAAQDSRYYFLQDSDISPLLLEREKFSHKGTFGHSLLISGAYGKVGAAILASHACLCSGTGLLTTHIPRCGYQIMQTALPEAMVSIDTTEEHISTLPPLAPYTSIGIGPGIGQHPDTARVLKLLIQSTPSPLVIDADALNILSEHKTWLAFLPPRSILTPHPKEFDRLTEQHSDSWERLRSAQELAHRHSLIIVLKGAYTATVMPDRSVWFNSTGSPALAKGGSGDVLTGILTALLSRGYEASDAAFIGVYLHGLAADLAISDIHPESLLASDVIAHISDAFRYLYGEKDKSRS